MVEVSMLVVRKVEVIVDEVDASVLVIVVLVTVLVGRFSCCDRFSL